MTTDTTALASRGDTASGDIGNNGSYQAVLSDDGNLVAFYSYSDNLVAGDTNNTADVFLRNLAANQTTALSRGSSGELGNNFSFSPAISGNGHCVAFRSYADNMDPAVGVTDFSFVYMRTIAGECPNDPPDTTITGHPPAKTRSRAATITSTSNDSTAIFECALDGAAFARCGVSHNLLGLRDGSHSSVAPRLTIVIPRQKLKQVLSQGLRLRVRSSERATASARVTRKGHVLGTTRKSVGTAARTLTIRLHLSKKARRALLKARSVRLVLIVVGKDALGNQRAVRRTITIRH